MEPFHRAVHRLALPIALATLLGGCLDEAGDVEGMTSLPQSVVSGPEGTTENVLIPARTRWEYDDRGIDLGTSWRNTSPSSAWRTGNGPLGYGETYLATTVSYGSSASNKHPTTYFRRAFDGVDPARIRKLYLRVMFDDGFVFYLDGHEGGRASMPGGTITFPTLAQGHESGNAYVTYDVSSQIPHLAAGANTLAIEVHQQTRNSSDLVMDAELIAWVEPDADEPPAHEPTVRGIPSASTWSYWDQGGDLGTGWRQPGYVETGWSAGEAPLGFGESYIATETERGPITTYFRHQFISNGSAVGMHLAARFDDGFVAYLNGTEIDRRWMPPGAVTASTRAQNHEADGYARLALSQFAHLIVEGVNTLAIEVHNTAATSSDLVWDARLEEETAWQPQVSGTTEDLNDVLFHFRDLGWVVGDAGTILHTSNAGRTWTAQPSGTTADLRAIALVTDDYGEPDTAWIIGDGGVILRSGDGGNTWQDTSLPAPAQLRDISVIGTSGWAVAQLDSDDTTADLYYTADGGLTWEARPTGISGGDFTAVLFDTYSVGFITGTSSDEEGGTIWRTADGGLSWTQVWTFGHHGGWPSSLSKQFPSSNFWMTGQSSSSGQGEIKIVSRDNGLTWQEAPRTESDVGIYDLAWNGSTTAIGVGLYGSIVRTEDGGNTWQISQRPHFYEHAILHAVEATYPPDFSWAVGTGGTILRTTSGGYERGWVMRDQDQVPGGGEVWFTSDQRGWLLGSHVHETRDGGETWTQPLGDSSGGHIEFLPDGRHGWIVGREETLATTDGGDTWTAYPNDASFQQFFITGIAFASPTNGWLVVHEASGAPSDLYTTTDGGATWVPTPTGLPQGNWLDVDFVSEDVGFLLGDHYGGSGGNVFKTTDGGATWFKPYAMDRYLEAIEAIDANTIWVVGSHQPTDGDLELVSRNGGGSWQSSPSTGQEPLDDVYFVDLLHGWAVGDYGTMVATRNGGQSWDVQVPGRTFARPLMLDVQFSDTLNGWALGTDQAVLETSTGGY